MRGTLDLNLPGRIVVHDVTDAHFATAQADLVDTDGTLFDSGTIKIMASTNGHSFPVELWEFTEAGNARFNVVGYKAIRAEVGTAASNRTIVEVEMISTQTG